MGEQYVEIGRLVLQQSGVQTGGYDEEELFLHLLYRHEVHQFGGDGREGTLGYRHHARDAAQNGGEVRVVLHREKLQDVGKPQRALPDS